MILYYLICILVLSSAIVDSSAPRKEKVFIINDENSEGEPLQIHPQGETQSNLNEFTLCFRFLLYSFIQQTLFSSPHISFSIESPSHIIGIIVLDDRFEYIVPLQNIELTPMKWISLCLVKSENLGARYIRVYLDQKLSLDQSESNLNSSHMQSYIFDKLVIGPRVPSHLRGYANPFRGMMTHFMCSSKALQDMRSDFYYDKLRAKRFDIFNWNRVNMDDYESKFVVKTEVYKMEARKVLHEEANYLMALRSCRFVKGIISFGIQNGEEDYFWSKYTKLNSTPSIFLDLNHQKDLESVAWEVGEPNGRNKQNCLIYNTRTLLHKDQYCNAMHRSECVVHEHQHFTLRGIPSFIKNIENDFFSTVSNGTLSFVGLNGNIIKKIDSAWVISTIFDPRVPIFVYKGSKIYPYGVNTWLYYKESSTKEIKLMFTNCTDQEFTCDNADCIPLNKVCDDFANCPTAEDEKDCSSVFIKAYKKEFPPPLKSTQNKTTLKIRFKLNAINNIQELENMLDMDFLIQMIWTDSRLIYYRLSSDAEERILTEMEKNQIWIPNLIFENTAEKYDDSLWTRNAQISLIKNPNVSGRSNSFSDLYRRIEYGGSDAEIIYHSQFKMKMYCSFHFYEYPFDTQRCSVIISLPFDLEERVKFVEDGSTHSAIELLQYKMTSLQFQKEDTKIVLVITFKRIFYNIFWTTYLPTFCLQIVVILTLFFPPERFETTIMITLTTTLVIYTLYQSVSISLPTTAYNKMIDYWLFFSLIMPFFVFVIEVLIELYSYKSMDSRVKNKISHFLEIYGKKIMIFVTAAFDVTYWISNLFYYYGNDVN